MSVQRILSLPDKGPLLAIPMELTRAERVKMQETGVDNLRLSKEYGQLVWGGSRGSSSLGKEEFPYCLWLKKEEETDGDTDTFGYGGQWGNSHQLLLTFSTRKVLGREAWISLDWLESPLWRCHFRFPAAWWTPTNPSGLLTTSSGLLRAKAESRLCHPHLFIYFSLTTSVMPVIIIFAPISLVFHSEVLDGGDYIIHYILISLPSH